MPEEAVITPETTIVESSNESIFSLPEKFQGDKSFENIKSMDELCNQFVNAQSLIGKKASGIPGADADDSVWEEFHSKLRPEAPDKYELPDFSTDDPDIPVEFVEAMNKLVPDEVKTELKGLFHQAGLTQKQVAILAPGYNKIMMGYNKTLIGQHSEQEASLAAKNAQAEQTFDQAADKYLGENKNQMIDSAKVLIDKYFPEDQKVALWEAPPEYLIGMVKCLDSIKKNHLDEDKMFAPTQAAVGGETSTIAEFSSVVAELFNTKQGTAKYAELLERKANLAATISRFGG